jgi:hypothetical protein
MRNVIFTALMAATFAAGAQTTMPQGFDATMQKQLKELEDRKPKFGIKAGYNIAKINGKAANFSPDAKNGFTAAAFYSAGPRSGLGYRTELVFSRQGFEFTDDGKTATVTNDYVYMPHFTTFGIGKFFQVQVGGQLGYLLKSSKAASSETKSQDITSFANRLDYGAAAGVEIYPVKHLILGGRYNISFGNAYKRMTESSTTMPSPFPLPFNPDEVKGKNAVINFFVGFRF